jgi:hypothetical protein
MTDAQVDNLATVILACFCVIAFAIGFLNGQKAAN